MENTAGTPVTLAKVELKLVISMAGMLHRSRLELQGFGEYSNLFVIFRRAKWGGDSLKLS